MENKVCLICNKEFSKGNRRSSPSWLTAKYCSVKCLGLSKIGKPGGMRGKVSHNKGKTFSDEYRKRLSIAHMGQISWNKGKRGEYALVRSEEGKKSFKEKMSGENNPRWIKDRTKLAKRQERNDMAYKDWRKQVWLRDAFKCKIANGQCNGRLEAHHILNWKDYPELRYEVNNGITLCHAHHPRKRVEEQKLSPYFQQLVTEKN